MSSQTASASMATSATPQPMLMPLKVVVILSGAVDGSLERLKQRESSVLVGSVAPSPIWRIAQIVVNLFPGMIIEPITLDEREVVHRLINQDVDFAITTASVNIPTVPSHPFFDEHLSVILPTTHPLAQEESLLFEQLDGESFLVDAAAGFWLDVLRKHLPKSKIIEQTDRLILMKLIEGIGLLSFTTTETEEWGLPENRIAIPLADEDAHVSFFLSVLANAPERIEEILGVVAQEAAAV